MANLQLAPQISEWSEAITPIPKSLRTGVATALLALSLVSGSPAQAETQPWVGVTPSGTPSTSAIASADKGVGYGQMTKDGREFGKLTEKEVDGLGDAEYDAYQKWKIAQKNTTLIKTWWLADAEWAKALVYEESIKKNWSNIQQKLRWAPDSIIKQALLEDIEWSKKLLNYVIANNLPPPWFAHKLLKMISA